MVFKSESRIIVRFMFGGLENFLGIYFRDDYFVNHCKAFCDLPFFCLKKNGDISLSPQGQVQCVQRSLKIIKACDCVHV